MDGIGGEEDVLWGAVGELLRERRGGAEGGHEMDACSALVSGRERGHYRLEVGGAGELKLSSLRVDDWGEDREGEKSEEGSAHKATVV
jgi:hypothetical protein